MPSAHPSPPRGTTCFPWVDVATERRASRIRGHPGRGAGNMPSIVRLRVPVRLCTRTAILAVLSCWTGTGMALDLNSMSIEELAQIEVTSVTKSAQPLSEAPSAIYVITREEILRSGAPNLPEMLRLAPNLQVAQTSASQYAITARGFSGSPAAQNFANKLLVLIDGRSVYTPLYSGVYWDMQDILSEDVDRIEVISGPGATLWGANAVNGVINIITRPSDATQGAVLSANGGSNERSVGFRYGGKASEALSYRVYVRGYEDDQTRTAAGVPAQDGWSRVQGGFRVDWEASAQDSLTVQGDLYDGDRSQFGAPDEDIEGRNLLTRWNRGFADDSALQVQLYYDRTERKSGGGGGGFSFETYDLDVQHSFALGTRHDLVVGSGVRVSRYDIVGNFALDFEPAKRTLRLANAFVQDSIRISDAVRLVLGLKIEDYPYAASALLPNVRLSVRLGESTMVWAAASRAVRSPTPFDRDVRERIGTTLFLIGGPDFTTEKLTAFELGGRAQPSERLSLSASAFYNRYDDLRSAEFNLLTLLPLEWGNMIRGRTYGVEAWGSYGVTPWWKLSAGVNVLKERFRFKPDATALLLPGLPGVEQQGNDPEFQASIKSAMNLGSRATIDLALRHVGRRPLPRVSSYVELDAHVAVDLAPGCS
ncbi:TonB-dependent receptor [Rhizorhabdus dicambivorans]|nr:TonB-dependent receptor [Rhizorhabdus dicambivorans]